MNLNTEDVIKDLCQHKGKPCVYEVNWCADMGKKRYRRYKTTFTAYSLEEACCRILARVLYPWGVYSLKSVVTTLTSPSFEHLYPGPHLSEFTLDELLRAVGWLNTGVYFFKNLTEDRSIIDRQKSLKDCLHGKLEKKVYNLKWKD